MQYRWQASSQPGLNKVQVVLIFRGLHMLRGMPGLVVFSLHRMQRLYCMIHDALEKAKSANRSYNRFGDALHELVQSLYWLLDRLLPPDMEKQIDIGPVDTRM